jgi:hypothetical protein
MESTQQRSVLPDGTSEVATAPDPTFNGLWTEDWHCQFCGEKADDYYMIQPALWERIIGEPYHYGSGYACLGCAAERLYPRQLRNEDFNDPAGDEDEDGRLNTQWIEGGDLPGFAAYRITFPEQGGDTVRMTVEEDNWGWPKDQFELIEALEDERFGWLWEYAAAHGLKLQWVDDATYQPRFEGEARPLLDE